MPVATKIRSELGNNNEVANTAFYPPRTARAGIPLSRLVRLDRLDDKRPKW